MKYLTVVFTFGLILSACVPFGQATKAAFATPQVTQPSITPQPTSTLQLTPTLAPTPTPLIEPSDWIATAALGTTIIVSIAGFIFNYLTNKQNIKARHAEIVTEKSIEAFREIVEKLINASDLFYKFLEYSNPGTAKTDAGETLIAIQEIRNCFNRYRVYLPETISEDIYSLFKQWEEVKYILHKKIYEKLLDDRIKLTEMEVGEIYNFKSYMGKEFSRVFTDTEKIIERIQRNIGVETSENPEEGSQ